MLMTFATLYTTAWLIYCLFNIDEMNRVLDEDAFLERVNSSHPQFHNEPQLLRNIQLTILCSVAFFVWWVPYDD